MSAGVTPPLPMGTWRNGRSKNSRKDPFFPQIPGCNLVPQKWVEGGRKERPEKSEGGGGGGQNRDSDKCSGIYEEFRKHNVRTICCPTEQPHCFVEGHISVLLLIVKLMCHLICVTGNGFSSNKNVFLQMHVGRTINNFPDNNISFLFPPIKPC